MLLRTSILVRNGGRLAYVRVKVGHRSVQTTVFIYPNFVHSGNRQAVDWLDDATWGFMVASAVLFLVAEKHEQ